MRLDTSRATSPRPRRRRTLAVVSLALLPALALTLLASHLLAQTALASSTVSFAPAVSYPVGTNPTSVAVGDVNGDGHPDLVTANSQSGTVSVLLGNVDGTLGSATNYSVGFGINPTSVAIGDLNGDGAPDIVTANSSSNNVSVLLRTSVNGFGPAQTYPVGTDPVGVAIGYINGTGTPYIVTANAGSDNASVLLGVGFGGFAAAVNYSVGTSLSGLAIGDLNGDSHPDLVVTSADVQGFNFGAVIVLLGDSSGGFVSTGNAYPTDLGSSGVAVADVNGDGHLDVVTANGSSNDVNVLLGDGAGGFNAESSYPVGANPSSVAVADFNGDGHADLVTANSFTADVSVLLGDGTHTFSAPQNFAVGASPISVTVEGLNSDGKPDIVTANFGSSDVSVLLNTTVSSSPTPTPTVSPTPGGGGGSNTAQVTVALAPGELSATTNAAPSLSATLNGQDQTLNYNLPITVTDGTATGNGWNLTITSTQFSTSGAPVNTLPTTASTVVSVASACASGTCVDPTNTVSYPLTLPAGTTAPTPVKLFNAAVGTGMGIFTVTPSVNILVPATTVAGTYTSTITLAIVSGP